MFESLLKFKPVESQYRNCFVISGEADSNDADYIPFGVFFDELPDYMILILSILQSDEKKCSKLEGFEVNKGSRYRKNFGKYVTELPYFSIDDCTSSSVIPYKKEFANKLGDIGILPGNEWGLCHSIYYLEILYYDANGNCSSVLVPDITEFGLTYREICDKIWERS